MSDSSTVVDTLMLDRADLAHHFRVDTRTIDRWRSEGYLPAPTIVKGGKIRLWSRAVIEQWILEQDKGEVQQKTPAATGVKEIQDAQKYITR